jgi:hypothetical protein
VVESSGGSIWLRAAIKLFIYRYNGINWQDISAKKIIFCEGYHAIHNPWFNYLPFQLAKGEILTLTAKQILP